MPSSRSSPPFSRGTRPASPARPRLRRASHGTNLPRAARVVSVDREGRLYLNIGGNPQVAVDEDTVAARATAALRRNPEVQVLVKADSAVAYGRVVQAMVILQHAGARKVGFITDPLPERARRGS